MDYYAQVGTEPPNLFPGSWQILCSCGIVYSYQFMWQEQAILGLSGREMISRKLAWHVLTKEPWTNFTGPREHPGLLSSPQSWSCPAEGSLWWFHMACPAEPRQPRANTKTTAARWFQLRGKNTTTLQWGCPGASETTYCTSYMVISHSLFCWISRM